MDEARTSEKRAARRLSRWVRIPLLTLAAVVLFLLAAEGSLRLLFALRDRLFPPERIFSQAIGWQTAANEDYTRVVPGYGTIHYSTGQDGFRVFGDLQSKKTKVLVLGDSFTQCANVSDGETYYDYLQEHEPNIEVFAYGCGGYGSLQEYMILDRYVGLIRPDIVLWQFCGNDFINNSFEMEADSTADNNHMTRPYYEDGRVVLRYPARLGGLRGKLVEHSYLLRALKVAARSLVVPNPAQEPSRGHPAYPAALKATSDIMGMVVRRAAPAVVVAFPVGSGPEEEDFRAICGKLGIRYVAGVPAAVEKARAAGVAVDAMPSNRHWSGQGNAVAGRAILDYLLAEKLVPAPTAASPAR